MNIIEKKIDALISLALCETPEGREEIRNRLYLMVCGGDHLDTGRRIDEVLNDIGVPANLSGYRYLHTAIGMVMDNPHILGSITKDVYPEVAKVYGVTASRVERTIRHAIEVAWDRGNFEVQRQYFRNTISPERGKPSNSEFIARISWYLIRNK